MASYNLESILSARYTSTWKLQVLHDSLHYFSYSNTIYLCLMRGVEVEISEIFYLARFAELCTVNSLARDTS